VTFDVVIVAFGRATVGETLAGLPPLAQTFGRFAPLAVAFDVITFGSLPLREAFARLSPLAQTCGRFPSLAVALDVITFGSLPLRDAFAGLPATRESFALLAGHGRTSVGCSRPRAEVRTATPSRTCAGSLRWLALAAYSAGDSRAVASRTPEACDSRHFAERRRPRPI
jgi:hypothetical protein